MSDHTSDITAYRRRAIAVYGLGAWGLLLLSFLVPYWCHRSDPRTLLFAGIGCSILAIPLHILAGSRKVIFGHRKRHFLYWPAMLLNIGGISLCISAYITHLNTHPTAARLLVGALVPLLLCAVFAILHLCLPSLGDRLAKIGLLLSIVLLITALVLWICLDEKTLVSFAFFNLFGVLCIHATALYVYEDTDCTPLRYLSFASFGLLLVVAIVAGIILMLVSGDGCDCDCGDGCCDCGDGCDASPGSSTGRKRNKRSIH